MAAGIGAGHHAHAGRQRAADGLAMVLAQRARALAHVRGLRLAVVLVHEQRGREERGVRGHHRDQLGVLVEVAAVLDGVHAGLQRHAQAGAAEGMAHHLAALRVRLVTERAHLVERERRILGPVAGARGGAAGGRALDDVGARADHRAHNAAHVLDAGGHAARQRGIARDQAGLVPRRTDAIADAADGRDDRHRRQQARADDEALVDRRLEAGVETAGIADGRVARPQRLLDHARGAQVARAALLVELPACGQLVAVERQVVVAVDEARQDRGALDVDDLGARRPVGRGARDDRLHAAVVEDEARLAHRRPAGAVDQRAAAQDEHVRLRSRRARRRCRRRSSAAWRRAADRARGRCTPSNRATRRRDAGSPSPT